MKNRFNSNDENNFPEDIFPSYSEDDGEEYGEGHDRELEADEIAQAIELERLDLNQKILFRTVKMLEKSWFWRFRSEKTKRRMISESFLINQRLIVQGEFVRTDYQ